MRADSTEPSRPQDEDDPFAHTRMTFGEHLEELRLHLWRAVLGLLVILPICLWQGGRVLRFISAPVEEQLGAFYENRAQQVALRLDAGDQELQRLNRPLPFKISLPRRELYRQLNLRPPDNASASDYVELQGRLDEPLRLALGLREAEQVVGRRPALSTLSVQEAFMAWVKVSMATAAVVASPWIFWQLWQFIAAGLYPREKRLVHVYLPVSLGLFLAGVAICQFAVIPQAIRALLWFNQWMGLEPELRFSEWLTFAILMPLVFGISFQLPLLMMFLERVGLFTVQSYISKWKIACFVIHVFAGVMVPSADIVSMEALALPMFGLYGLGILLCRLNPSGPLDETDVPDPHEMVEA